MVIATITIWQTMAKSGPPKQFPDNVLVQLPEGTKERVRAMLDDGETLGQVARQAILEWIERRTRRNRRREAKNE